MELCNGSSRAHGYVHYGSTSGCRDQDGTHTALRWLGLRREGLRHPGALCATDYLVSLERVTIRRLPRADRGEGRWYKGDGPDGVGIGVGCAGWPPAEGITFVDMYEHRVAASFEQPAATCDGERIRETVWAQLV